MSQRHIGCSLVYKTRQEQAKRLPKDEQGKEGYLDNQNQVTFYLNYQEHDHSTMRKRSQILEKYSQMQKLRVRQKPFPFPKMMQIRKDFNIDSKPPKNVSLNFDFFNPKKKQRQISTESDRLQRFEETAMLSKEKYLEKVQRQNRKKHQRCSLLKNYGLNIKTAQRFENQQRHSKKLESSLKDVTPSESTISRNNNIRTACQIQPKRNLSEIRQFENQTGQARSFVLKALEQTEKSKLKSRQDKMMKSQRVVLQSFGCYLQESRSERDQKYKFFVGSGNNRTLICYILKKRWWWTETNDSAGAHLVWTQLKHKSTLKKIDEYDQEEMPLVDALTLPKLSRTSSFKKIKITSSFFHQKMKNQLESPLSEAEQKLVLNPFKVPSAAHNHFSRSDVLGNKNSLFLNLESYYAFKQQDVYSIIPLTFVIDSCTSKQFEQFQARSAKLKKSVWIVKPGENSNRGNGIFVTNSIEDIRQRVSSKSKQKFIIQKYISNLFLYQKRKFDIRTYVLMVSIRGVTKFLWYNEGYIRTSSEIFDIKDLSDFFVHLTNDAVQNKNQNYGKYEQGNKISYSEFQLYLDYNYLQENYSIKKLHQEMKIIATQAIKATSHQINPEQKMYGFELFGLDFIVDSEFKPWLIEFNTNPCLELSSPVLDRILPTMLENMFRIAVDPIFRPNEDSTKPKHFLYENCLQKNKFQLIFDSLFDRDLRWQKQSTKQQKTTSEESKQ